MSITDEALTLTCNIIRAAFRKNRHYTLFLWLAFKDLLDEEGRRQQEALDEAPL